MHTDSSFTTWSRVPDSVEAVAGEVGVTSQVVSLRVFCSTSMSASNLEFMSFPFSARVPTIVKSEQFPVILHVMSHKPEISSPHFPVSVGIPQLRGILKEAVRRVNSFEELEWQE